MNDAPQVPVKQRASHTPLGWLRGEIDRLFDDFAPARGIFNFGVSGFVPVPALEMTSCEGDYRLTAELPGLKEADVELSVADGMLTLKGEKRSDREEKNEGFLLNERSYGSFERRVSLPADVDAERISAEFNQGVLTITLPRNADAAERTRKIAITTKG